MTKYFIACNNCDEKFASTKHLNAKLIHDRPRCGNCGSRDCRDERKARRILAYR